MGDVQTAGIDRKLTHQLHAALTADKEQLYGILQEQTGEVLLAALRNPSLDDTHLLVLLKRRGLPESLFTSLYAAKPLIESYPVRLALVCNPETPTHISQTLLPQLYLFDLLKVCLMPGFTADHRLLAERCIIQRLPTQPLGNKLTLARRCTPAVAEALLREGVPQVVAVCLDNPRLKEGAVHQFLSSYQATAETISMVARHERWKGRPNIRLAILRNPRTPPVWFTLFLPGLPPATLRDLLAGQRLTAAQKELVRAALGGRPA